jgi:hypothetical protein
MGKAKMGSSGSGDPKNVLVVSSSLNGRKGGVVLEKQTMKQGAGNFR